MRRYILTRVVLVLATSGINVAWAKNPFKNTPFDTKTWDPSTWKAPSPSSGGGSNLAVDNTYWKIAPDGQVLVAPHSNEIGNGQLRPTGKNAQLQRDGQGRAYWYWQNAQNSPLRAPNFDQVATVTTEINADTGNAYSVTYQGNKRVSQSYVGTAQLFYEPGTGRAVFRYGKVSQYANRPPQVSALPNYNANSGYPNYPINGNGTPNGYGIPNGYSNPNAYGYPNQGSPQRQLSEEEQIAIGILQIIGAATR